MDLLFSHLNFFFNQGFLGGGWGFLLLVSLVYRRAVSQRGTDRDPDPGSLEAEGSFTMYTTLMSPEQ